MNFSWTQTIMPESLDFCFHLCAFANAKCVTSGSVLVSQVQPWRPFDNFVKSVFKLCSQKLLIYNPKYNTSI